MRERPRVAMVIQDPHKQTRYLGIRGEVIGYTKEGADEHINRLSLKYDGKPWSPRQGQQRIIYRIKPIHFDPHDD